MTQPHEFPLAVSPADPADAAAVVETIAEAFLHDPTWSWAFPDPEGRRRLWHRYIRAALRYPWVLCTPRFESVAVWTPPGGTELTPEDEAHLPTFLVAELGPRASDVAELLRRFAEAHPVDEPHYYLGLLATADRHRGRGLGIGLLRESLARIDALGVPTYLESTNPGNDRRYAALGFRPVVSFRAPGDGPTVTGMWRPVP